MYGHFTRMMVLLLQMTQQLAQENQTPKTYGCQVTISTYYTFTLSPPAGILA